MSDENKTEVYLELFKAQFQRFENTRNIQWKINLAFWSMIIISGSFLHGKYYPNWWEVIVIIILFLGMHLGWTIPIQKSLDFDKNLFSKYRHRLEIIVAEEAPEQIPPSKLGWKWPFFQSVVTFFLLLLTLNALIKAPRIKQNHENKKEKIETLK